MEGLLPSLLRLSKLTGDVCNQLYGSDEVKGHSMPTPWSKGKSLESIHPVFDQYKLEQTVSFPGAKQLYLKFDERCSSQYDYDKVSDSLLLLTSLWVPYGLLLYAGGVVCWSQCVQPEGV